MGLLRRLLGGGDDAGGEGATAAGPPARVSGEPPSGNGASSFHLFWDLPFARAPIVEVSAVLEVVEPPAVDRLYFWALQAGFVDDLGRSRGAGHLGPQWHPDYPGAKAMCWGGYRASGGELSGGPLGYPSPLGNPNVCAFDWPERAPMTLRIRRGPGGGWLGEVLDGATGTAHAVRELDVDAPYLADPIVWSEVFARCEHPSVRVRWSQLAVVGVDGSVRLARSVRVNYQSHRDGGCANTTALSDGTGVVQVTATERVTPQGAVLALG